MNSFQSTDRYNRLKLYEQYLKEQPERLPVKIEENNLQNQIPPVHTGKIRWIVCAALFLLAFGLKVGANDTFVKLELLKYITPNCTNALLTNLFDFMSKFTYT